MVGSNLQLEIITKFPTKFPNCCPLPNPNAQEREILQTILDKFTNFEKRSKSELKARQKAFKNPANKLIIYNIDIASSLNYNDIAKPILHYLESLQHDQFLTYI